MSNIIKLPTPALILPDRWMSQRVQQQQGLFAFGFVGGGAAALDTDAVALFARMTNAPSTARKASISNLIVALKAAGVWTKLDAFYIFAAADQQAAFLNWLSTSYTVSYSGSAPTFTADRGVQTASASSANRLTTGFTPSTAPSPKFTLNSSHLGLWMQVGQTLDNGTQFTDDDTNMLQPNAGNFLSANRSYVRINSPGDNAILMANSNYNQAGHFVGNRSSSTAFQGYYNGTSFGSITLAAATIGTGPLRISSAVSNAAPVAAASIGASLSSGEALAMYNAIRSYITDVGA